MSEHVGILLHLSGKKAVREDYEETIVVEDHHFILVMSDSADRSSSYYIIDWHNDM